MSIPRDDRRKVEQENGMRQMTLADWMPEDCPDFDLSQHMNPPEVLDKDQVEEDPLPTDRPTTLARSIVL